MRKKNIKEVAQNYSLVPQSKDAENRTPDEQAADIARDFNEEEGDNVNANALIKSKQNLEEGDKVISVKRLREMALLTKYNGITLTSVGNILKENNNKLSNLIYIADQVDEALENGTYTFRGMVEHILNQNNAIFLKDKKGRKYTADDFLDKDIIPTNQNHKGRLLLKNGTGLATQGLSISRDLSNIDFEEKYPPKWKDYLAQYIANPDVVGGNFLKQLKEANTYAEQMDYYDFVRKTIIKDDNNGQILIGLPNKLLDGERRFVTNFYENLENGFKTKKYKKYLDEKTIRNFLKFSKNANSTNSDFTSFEKNALKPCIEAFDNLIRIDFKDIKIPGDDKAFRDPNTRTIRQGEGKPGKNCNLSQEEVEGTSRLQWLSLFISQIKLFINAYTSIYNKKRNEYAKVANDINDEMGGVIITMDDVRQTAVENIDIKKLNDLISHFQETYTRGISKFINRYENNNKIITDITNNPNIDIDNAITRIKTIKPLLKGEDYVEELLEILKDAHKKGYLKDRGANGGESATKRGVTQSSLTEASKKPTYIINETQLKELIRIGLI